MTNVSSIRSRGSSVARQRKLKIGSSTAPAEPESLRRSASGAEALLVRPRNRERSVSYSIAPVAPVRTCAAQIGAIFRRASAPPCQKHSAFRTLGFDEHFGERRMRRIGAMRSEREFQIAGELELPAAERAIGDGQTPQFGVVVGGHGHVHDGFNAKETPGELGAIRGEANRGCTGGSRWPLPAVAEPRTRPNPSAGPEYRGSCPSGRAWCRCAIA